LQLTLSEAFFGQTTAAVLLAWRKHKRRDTSGQLNRMNRGIKSCF